MDRHCENALAVGSSCAAAAGRVGAMPASTTPDKPLVDKYMGGRASSILSFGIKGGRAAGAKFIDA